MTSCDETVIMVRKEVFFDKIRRVLSAVAMCLEKNKHVS